MPNAKTLDRLELTRQKFSGSARHIDGQAVPPQHRQGYSICPDCGKETLRHDGSCVICENCSYSKCG